MNFMAGTIKNNKGLSFNEGTIKLPVPTKFTQQLTPFIDKKIIFGVRPEDIYDASFAPGIQKTAQTKCLLEVVEPMGNELFLYFNSGIHQFVARVGAHETPTVGQNLKLIFNMEKGHFFDPETEKHL